MLEGLGPLRPVGADEMGMEMDKASDLPEITVGEDGEVVGRGRHQALIESCPTYAEIVASQLGAGAVT